MLKKRWKLHNIVLVILCNNIIMNDNRSNEQIMMLEGFKV